MTDPTSISSPDHEVESLTEQRMRSDFMHGQHSYLSGNILANTERDGMER